MSKTTKAEFLAARKQYQIARLDYRQNEPGTDRTLRFFKLANRQDAFRWIAERYADALIEEDEGEKESRTGTCRWCGQTYENHSDNGPATRMPCLGHKNGFVKDEGEKSNQSKGPTL